MYDEYGSLTPRVERIRDFATPASAGKICFTYTSRVSHPGRSDDFHFLISFLGRRERSWNRSPGLLALRSGWN